MFANADTHVDTIGAATSPPPAAILDKEDADAEDAVDASEVRDDDAAKDILEVILMLLLVLRRHIFFLFEKLSMALLLSGGSENFKRCVTFGSLG